MLYVCLFVCLSVGTVLVGEGGGGIVWYIWSGWMDVCIPREWNKCWILLLFLLLLKIEDCIYYY